VNEGLANGERPLRWLGDSAARLTAASALLLATNLLWIIAVVLNVIGPVGSLSAGLLAWLAFVLDIPGVLLLAAAYAGLTREQGLGWNRRRLAIVWGFIFWTGVSVYWRFILPLAIGTDLQDLFLGLLGANPGGLRLAQASWASMDELFAWWIAAGAVFFATHVLIAVDYRRSSEGEWTAGLPAYVWVLGAAVSLLSTILIVTALLPVLGAGLLGSTFTSGVVGKLLVAPNVMLSGYLSSLQLGRSLKAARRARDAA